MIRVVSSTLVVLTAVIARSAGSMARVTADAAGSSSRAACKIPNQFAGLGILGITARGRTELTYDSHPFTVS